MKENFYKYLLDIGITKTYGKKVEEIYNFYKNVCLEPIEDVFITDYITEDQLREYESLWFFSKNYAMEAKRFIKEYDLDMSPISKVTRWEIKKKDYDFENATEKSRMSLHFSSDIGITFNFKASKENCDYLKKIFNTYINSNMQE
ncbi:hypothetical protein [Methanobacterium sp.]|uniref:hypothetical protein n=1 Tax=Methanobacterium sp. TaxID=2164 RepID=UPI003C74EBA4